ncbi:MAG: PAS domain-containing protein [Chloroflexi bacterium]|nr:PAS domain-containing protein [Chloroflexota bacterium]
MDSETENGDLGLGVLVRALEPSADALEITDLEGNIVYVNGSWSRLFAWDGKDVAGAAWDLVRADGAEYIEVKNSWKRCVEVVTSQGTFSASIPDGAKRVVSYARTLSRDSDGAAFAVVTIYRPISEAATIREPSQLLVALLERRYDGVAVLDEDGSVIAANKPFAILVGYEGRETIGLGIDTIMPGVEEIKSLVSGGVVWWGGNVDVARQDGSSISTWMSMDTVKDPRGRVIGFVLRTKSAGAQEIPGRDLAGLPTDPLSRLVHDMRNVFTAIESNLYLALRISTDQSMHQRLVAIQDASKKGIEVLDSVHH